MSTPQFAPPLAPLATSSPADPMRDREDSEPGNQEQDWLTTRRRCEICKQRKVRHAFASPFTARHHSRLFVSMCGVNRKRNSWVETAFQPIQHNEISTARLHSISSRVPSGDDDFRLTDLLMAFVVCFWDSELHLVSQYDGLGVHLFFVLPRSDMIRSNVTEGNHHAGGAAEMALSANIKRGRSLA